MCKDCVGILILENSLETRCANAIATITTLAFAMDMLRRFSTTDSTTHPTPPSGAGIAITNRDRRREQPPDLENALSRSIA
jgi:hypothetical protein